MSIEESNSEDRVAATAYRPPGDPVNEHNFQEIIGGAVYDFDGDVIGEAWQVYLDDESTRPQWLTVRTSLFRSSEYFVPLAGAQRSHDGVRVNYGKHTVKGAPRIDVKKGFVLSWSGQHCPTTTACARRGETPAADSTDATGDPRAPSETATKRRGRTWLPHPPPLLGQVVVDEHVGEHASIPALTADTPSPPTQTGPAAP